MARGRARTESACRARRRVTTGPGPAIQRPKTADSQRGCIGPALRAETAGTLISWGDPSAGLADQAGGAEVGAIPFADSAGGVLKVRSIGIYAHHPARHHPDRRHADFRARSEEHTSELQSRGH